MVYFYMNQKKSDRWRYTIEQFLVIILISPLLLLQGCSASVPIHQYINPETSIKLERPDNWTAYFYKRNWMIVLKTNKGIWNEASARIEILGGDVQQPT